MQEMRFQVFDEGSREDGEERTDMDYSNSTGVRIMTPIASQAGCHYQPFSQKVLLEGVQEKVVQLGGAPVKVGRLQDGADGVCYGLAVAWLETMQRKGGDFIAQVADLESSSLFYRAYVAFRHQDIYAAISTSGTWQDGDVHRGDRSGADQFFGIAAMTQNSRLVDAGKARSFGLSRGGMDAFCAWLGASFDKRYFMLSVPRHAMAAIGSRSGRYSVFDPNCGIVSALSPRTLAGCLHRYFSDPTIKSLYRGADEDWLTATKFKT